MTGGDLGYGRKKLIDNIINTHWANKTMFSYQELLFIIQEMQRDEGQEYLEGQNIHRGFEVYRNFVKYLLYRNLANYDSMILLTGQKGTGKSSAALMIAKEWCKIIGIRFNPERHIAYNNKEVSTKIDNLNKFEPIICDESVRFITSEDWAKKEHKDLRRKLAQVRTKHLLYILCFPMKISKVEKTYLESFTNYWIDLIGRGVGAIFVKDFNPVHDSWRMQEFKDIGSYSEFTDSTAVQKILKKHPNFWNVIKFPKPSKKLYDNYLVVREKNIYADDNVWKDVSKEDIQRALLILTLRDIMLHDVSLNINRILLHIKNNYDITLNKSVVESIIEDSKQMVLKTRQDGITEIEK